jgi:hypothetical protein
MSDDTIDLREKLFLEFKDSNSRLEEIRSRIREQHDSMELMHKEANDAEREMSFLRRTVHLVLTEDMDPVLAKFQVSEEFKKEERESNIAPGRLFAVSHDSDKPRRKSKIRRMFRAIREIWNERY